MLRFLCAADILGMQRAVAVWLKCREYSTSRGPPPCQRASWTERPSCRGRWGKKRQASLKKLQQQGNSGTEASHGQSRHGYYEKKKKRLHSCFSPTDMLLEAELVQQEVLKPDTNLIVVHTQCILTVRPNKVEIIGFS